MPIDGSAVPQSQASQRKNLALIDRVPAMEAYGGTVIRTPEKKEEWKRAKETEGKGWVSWRKGAMVKTRNKETAVC